MNNAQKKIASNAGFRKYLDEGCTLYYHDISDRDALLKEAYLQGWNDAEDAHGEKQDEP